MIVGTLALLTMLLGGGTFNTFVFEDLDKYAKKVMVDEERKEYVLEELKIVKKSIKEYYKVRGKKIKELKEVNIDRNTDLEDFKIIEDELRMERDKMDQYMVDKRMSVIKNIDNDEWDEIIRMSAEDAQNQKANEEEKELKGKIKNIFEKMESTIAKSIADTKKADNVLGSLDKLKTAYYEMESNVINRYPEDNKILIKKNSEQEELNQIYSEVFTLRESYVAALKDFHFEALEQTNEKEWKKIMKEMNNIIR
jgi:hypothetical protein